MTVILTLSAAKGKNLKHLAEPRPQILRLPLRFAQSPAQNDKFNIQNSKLTK
jgi:hypothetical protein